MRLSQNGDSLSAPVPIVTHRDGELTTVLVATGLCPEHLFRLDRIAYAEGRRRQSMDPAELALEDLIDAELERRLLYGS